MFTLLPTIVLFALFLINFRAARVIIERDVKMSKQSTSMKVLTNVISSTLCAIVGGLLLYPTILGYIVLFKEVIGG